MKANIFSTLIVFRKEKEEMKKRLSCVRFQIGFI